MTAILSDLVQFVLGTATGYGIWLAGIKHGRLVERREIDVARARVREACERAAGARVRVPGQRAETD